MRILFVASYKRGVSDPVSSDELRRKLCHDCATDKPLSEFWKSQASRDGLAPYCTACFSLRNRAASDRRAAKAGRKVRHQKSRTFVTDEGMRYCPRCEVVMPVSEFVRNRSTRDGTGTYCRPCQNAQSAASIAKLHGSTRPVSYTHLTLPTICSV